MVTKRSLTVFAGIIGFLCFMVTSADAFRSKQYGDISVFTKHHSGKIIEVETDAEKKKAKEQKESGAVKNIKIGAKMSSNAVVSTMKTIMYQSPLGIFFSRKNGRSNYENGVGGPMVFEYGYPTLQSKLAEEDW